MQFASSATAGRLSSSSTDRASLAVLAVLAASAAVTALVGPVAVGVVAGATLALVWLAPRTEATVATLTIVWFLAVIDVPLRGTPLVIGEIAAPARVALLALLVFHGVRVLGRESVPLTRLLLPIAGFLAVIVFSILVADPQPAEQILVLPFAALLIGAHLVAWSATKNEGSLERLLRGLAWGYAVIALANLLLAFLVAQPAFLPTSEGPRFQGALQNPNTVGLFGFAAVPTLAIASVLAGRRTWERLIFSCAAALAVGQVLLSVSRGGIAAALVAILVLAVALTRGRTGLRLTGVVALGCVAVLFVASGVLSGASQSLRLDTVEEAGGRSLVVPLALESIRERPALGHGYGSEAQIFADFGPIGGFVGAYSGNVLMDLGLEVGLIGLAAFALAMLSTIARLRQVAMVRLSVRERRCAACFAAIFFAGLINAQSESYMLRPGGPSVVAFWLSVGVCSALGLRYAARHRSVAPGEREIDGKS